MAEGQPTISTHVLDLESGEPGAGVSVALFRLTDDGRPTLLAEAETDDDGRIRSLTDGPLEAGDYQLAFDVGGYLETDDDEAFFQSLAVALRITDVSRSYHVPLLLSPFGMSTYRGS